MRREGEDKARQGKGAKAGAPCTDLGSELLALSLDGSVPDFDIENISLVDYGSKEDEMFSGIDLNEDTGYSEPIDDSKIYTNELDGSESDASPPLSVASMDEEMKEFEKELRGSEMEVGALSAGGRAGRQLDCGANQDLLSGSIMKIEINSDVGNDICVENIRKIHAYVDSDIQKERDLSAAILRTKRCLEKLRRRQ